MFYWLLPFESLVKCTVYPKPTPEQTKRLRVALKTPPSGGAKAQREEGGGPRELTNSTGLPKPERS